MQSVSQESYSLLTANAPVEMTKQKVSCLTNFLNGLNITEVFHTDRIGKTNDVFKKYEECLVWLEEEYTKRPLEKSISARINPIIQNEHNHVIQSVLKKQILREGFLQIIHHPVDPFNSTSGDGYERLESMHLTMIITILNEAPTPISLTLDNLSMTDSELQLLIPAIAAGKINFLSLKNNKIGNSALKSLSDAIEQPKSALVSLSLDGNPVGDEGALAFTRALQNSNRPFTLSLVGTTISQNGIAALQRAEQQGKDSLLII